jgi:HAE1 family hydrophobic/amphiphilic exporter-1
MFLTRLSIQRPLTVLMGIIALVIMGLVAHSYLRVDRLPPVNFPFVSVSVSYPQASAQDVEQLVTIPIEDAVSGMEGVSRISSTSSEGSSNVNIQMVEDADANAAALEVGRRLAGIRRRLPTDASDPSVNKADPNAFPIMNIALTGAPLDQLYDIASTQMQPALQSVLGVATVNISGGLQREIRVTVDYAKLAAYNLTVSQIATALAAANVTSTVGNVQQGTKLLDLRAVGNFENKTDLENLVIAQTTNGPVLLRDVATVRDAYKDQTNLQRVNGQDAVGLSVVKNSGANALQVADDVKDTLNRLTSQLPPGTRVLITNDSSVFTRASLDAVQTDLALAVLLVAFVTLLFLHEWRNVVIIVLAIPTSMISTFFVMYALGFTLNVMTLMALALIIGILVDDSIVVLENINRHLKQGKAPREAAESGRAEIGLAGIAITFADVVVYVPIAFMSGSVGQLFRQYGLTVAAATLFSLLISFTLTPMLASRWLGHGEGRTGPLAAFGRWWDARFEVLSRFAGRVVPTTVNHRWLVVLLGALLVGAAIAMIQLRLVGTEYAPLEDDNNFNVNMSTPPGTTLQATDASARQLEALLQQIPEVQDVFASVSGGGGFGGFGGGGGRAGMAVQLVPKSQRGRSAVDITQQVRTFSRQIPGVTINASIQSPFGGGGGGGGNNLSVIVSGPELATLNQVATQVQLAAADVPGLTPLQNSSLAGTPELRIVLDAARMAQLGVTSQQVNDALRTTLGGRVVTTLRPTGKSQQDVTLVANDVDRTNLTSLMAIPIRGGAAAAAGGAAANTAVVTLGQVATVQSGTGPIQIQRTDRNRTLTLSGTAVNRPLGEVANELRALLANQQLPPGYSWRLGGQVDQLNSALGQLGQAIVLALILEYMLLVALYQSLAHPLVVMLAVPLGLVGSIFGLYLTGNTLNIFSLIGLIMGFGLVAKNGILLVDYTNTLRARGLERVEALAEAARTRLRPILMTSATVICGMIPLALKLESGAESRAPMAVVVIGAMLTSTFLALLVVPAVYTLLDDLQALFSRLFSRLFGRRAKPVAAEPAPATTGVTQGVFSITSGPERPE